MGGGLVLFGIGGGGALSGGLVDAITESNGGGGGVTTASRSRSSRRPPRRAPTRRTPQLWAAVARARFNLASAGDNVDQSTGEYTGRGQRAARGRRRAPGRSTSSSPATSRTTRVASLMVQAYSALGDGRQGGAARRRSIAQDRNSAGAYAQLALLAYQAGQTRKGDLARDKALELTEPDMRETLKGQLEGARPQAAARRRLRATPTPTPTPAAK